MNYGQRFLTLYRRQDQDHPQEKEMQKSKMTVWGGLTNSCEKKRQEHWSGLPFPSPMHESEKWKWSRSVVSDCSWPRGWQPTRLLHPWDFPGKSTGVGCHCLLWDWALRYSNIKRPGRREGVSTKIEMWSVRREDNQESEALWESLRREEFNLQLLLTGQVG